MAPPEDITNNNNKGTLYHSHGIEVYHKPKSFESMDHDAGFNLQKLAWIEDQDSPQAFARVRVLGDLEDDTVLVEHEDHSKVYTKHIISKILDDQFFFFFLTGGIHT
jgi:selenophosphate synthase